MNSLRRAGLIALGLVSLAGSTYLMLAYLRARESGLGFDTAVTNINVVHALYLSAAMVVGLVASHVYHHGSTQQEDSFRIGAVLKEIPTNRKFWMAVAASPLTLFVVLGAVGDANLNLSHYLLAFQNGFFWETVIVRPDGTPLTPSPSAAGQDNSGAGQESTA